MRIEVVPARMDKSHGIEVYNTSPLSFEDQHVFPAELIRRDKLAPCKFFVQRTSTDYLFLESFQEDPELVLEAALYLEAVFG